MAENGGAGKRRGGRRGRSGGEPGKFPGWSETKMKRLALLIIAMLLLPAASYSGDLNLGFGYPYLSVKYDFPVLSAEARYAAGSGISVYAGRGYWNFHRADPLTGFAGVEAGYISFNSMSMRGTGYEAALFVGGQYRLSRDFFLLMDFAPTLIMLRHAVYTDVTVSGVEFVVNAGVYYRFGGKGDAAVKDVKKKKIEGETFVAVRKATAPEKDLSLSPFVFVAKSLAAKEAAVDGKLLTPREEELITQLDSKDWQVRRKAAFELGRLKAVYAVEPLLVLLADGNEKVRGIAAMALGRIGRNRAYLPLTEKLRDPSSYVRSSVAKGIGYLGDKRGIKALQRLLKDEEPEVRKSAQDAVARLKGLK